MRLTGIRGKKGGYKLPFISIEWWLPPRSLRLALRVARPPRSAKRAPLWLRGLRRPPPARPAKVAGLALAAPPFQVGAWLRGGSRRGERRVPPPAGGGGLGLYSAMIPAVFTYVTSKRLQKSVNSVKMVIVSRESSAIMR